ncbi:MAG TPA: ABC transporter permease [Candidatus Kapabacteria bacterium]|nr:ABC transporter permease [Candidatus Kapabacteria bacterium]
MKIPLNYSFRSLWTRKLTTILTIAGVALVAFVFTAVLMLADGVKKTLVATGSDDNAIVLRKSAESETLSIITFDEANVIGTQPEIAVGRDGKPLLTKEVITLINLRKHGAGPSDLSNVTVRGVTTDGVLLRPQVKITSGRMFNFGASELIVGNEISDRFDGMEIGSSIKFAGRSWKIVGHYDAGRSGFASDIWGDENQILQAFNRQAFSSIVLRLRNPNDFNALKAKFESDPRMNDLKIEREKQFYAEQSETLGNFIRILGIVITVIFSFGAMIGAMITMYAAVANRTVEIGTLRALGFRRRNVLSAFLIESLFIALLGAGVGLVFASLLSFLTISTTDFSSFSEIAFGFSLTPGIIVGTLIFAVVMGFVGGFLPSFRAARLDIINALRSA